MSTLHNYNAFDFNTAFPKDNKWAHFNERQESNETRNRRPFRLVCGSNEAAILSIVMAEAPVLPVTAVQGDACWFQCRKFGLTSSTTYNAVQEFAREIKSDDLLRVEFETLLCVIGREAWLLLEEEEEEEEEEPSTDDRTTTTTTTTPAADDDDDDGSPASNLISNIDLPTIRDDFLRDLHDRTIGEETIRDIVGRHKNSKQTTIGTLRNQLKAWAEQPSNLHRKYHWYSVAQLKQRIKEIDSRAKPPTGKSAVLQLLVDCELKQLERDEAIANGEVCYCSCCCCCFYLLCL